MKKILLVGQVGCGKTTLCQRLNGLTIVYQKTQALDVVNQTIDSPGEYLERRAYLSSLMVTSVEADVVLFLQDATQERWMYSAGLAAAFPVPVIGVVTKIDAASPQAVAQAAELLRLAGAEQVFAVSPLTGEGMEPLLAFLRAPSSAPAGAPSPTGKVI